MQTFEHIHKILVIKLRHIGDVLLTVPVFRALRETFPDAHIAALVNSGTEEVLSGNPLINEVIVFDRSIKKMSPVQRYRQEYSFFRAIRLRGFDMAVDLTSGDRAALLSFLSGARYRIAYNPGNKGLIGKRRLYTHLAKKDGSPHAVVQNLNVVCSFGISTSDLTVDFFIPEEAKAFIRNILASHGISDSDTLIHVHPTSRWLFKCWRDEYMAEVMTWMLKRGFKVVVTAAPAEKEMQKAARILSLVGSHSGLVDLCGKTSIKQLGALSEASTLFFGVDTAPMHIAAAVGTPVVALFGPSDESKWRPWGDRHIVLSKEMLCKPCKKGSCEHMPIRDCMELIKPEDALSAINQALIDR